MIRLACSEWDMCLAAGEDLQMRKHAVVAMRASNATILESLTWTRPIAEPLLLPRRS